MTTALLIRIKTSKKEEEKALNIRPLKKRGRDEKERERNQVRMT